MLEPTLMILFVIFALIGVVCYFKKSTKNTSYILFAFAFLALGVVGAIHNENSAIAAYVLTFVASRKYKAKS